MDKTEYFKKMPLEEIKSIKPVWHEKVIDIDLKLQPDSLTENYICKGFHIYKSSWRDLLKVLEPAYSKLFSNQQLWISYSEHEKTSRILDSWINSTPLIPPMLIDNGYNRLVPSDGKHRMNAASVLNNFEMTFILFNIDIPKINHYFKPTLID